MKCVTSVKFQIRVNGELSSEFNPREGFVPRGPFVSLFISHFSQRALMNQAEKEGSLKGIKICLNAPSVSHLLFADDSLILCRAREGDAQKLQEILQLYEECSG
jgi:hypothetical protein